MSIIVKSPRFKHKTVQHIQDNHIQLLMQLLNHKSLYSSDKDDQLINLQKHPEIEKNIEWLRQNDLQFKELPKKNNISYKYVLDKLLTSYQNLDVSLFISNKQLEMFITKQYDSQDFQQFIDNNYINREAINNSTLITAQAKVSDFYYMSIINDRNAVFNYFAQKKWRQVSRKQQPQQNYQINQTYKTEAQAQSVIKEQSNIKSLKTPQIIKQSETKQVKQLKNEQSATQTEQPQQIMNQSLKSKQDVIIQTDNSLQPMSTVSVEPDISSISEAKDLFHLDAIPYFKTHINDSEVLKALKQALQCYFNNKPANINCKKILQKFTGLEDIDNILNNSQLMLPEAALYFNKDIISSPMLRKQLQMHVQNIQNDYAFIPTIKQFYYIALCCKNGQDIDVSQFVLQNTKQQPQRTYQQWSKIVNQDLEQQITKYINLNIVSQPKETKNKQIQCQIQQHVQIQHSDQASQTQQQSHDYKNQNHALQHDQKQNDKEKQQQQKEEEKQPIKSQSKQTNKNIEQKENLSTQKESQYTQNITQSQTSNHENIVLSTKELSKGENVSYKTPQHQEQQETNIQPQKLEDIVKTEQTQQVDQLKDNSQTEQQKEEKVDQEYQDSIEQTKKSNINEETKSMQHSTQNQLLLTQESVIPQEINVIQDNNKQNEYIESQTQKSALSDDSQIFKLDFTQDDGARQSTQQVDIFNIDNLQKTSQNTESNDKSQTSNTGSINLNISVNTIIEDEATDQQQNSSRSTIVSKKDSVLSNELIQQKSLPLPIPQNPISPRQLLEIQQNKSREVLKSDTQVIENPARSEINLNHSQTSTDDNQIKIPDDVNLKEDEKEQIQPKQQQKPPVQKKKKVKGIMGSKMGRINKCDANSELENCLDNIF